MEKQQPLIHEILEKIDPLRLSGDESDVRRIYLIWENRKDKNASSYPFRFSLDDERIIGSDYSEGPFGQAFACSLAYVLQEGLMLSSATSDTPNIGNGIVQLVSQIGVAARDSSNKTINEVVQIAIDRARSTNRADVANWKERLYDSFPPKHDDEVFLQEYQDRGRGIEMAIVMLQELLVEFRGMVPSQELALGYSK